MLMHGMEHVVDFAVLDCTANNERAGETVSLLFAFHSFVKCGACVCAVLCHFMVYSIAFISSIAVEVPP